MRPLAGIRGAVVWAAEWALAVAAVAGIAVLTAASYYHRGSR